jgi:hypothetical protein
VLYCVCVRAEKTPPAKTLIRRRPPSRITMHARTRTRTHVRTHADTHTNPHTQTRKHKQTNKPTHTDTHFLLAKQHEIQVR